MNKAEHNNRPKITFFDFFNLAVNKLQEKFDAVDGCSWLNKRLIQNSFDNLSFRCGNQIFSVLVDIQDKNGQSFIPPPVINTQIAVAQRYGFIPCKFSVIVPAFAEYKNISQIKLKNDNWNLYDSRTNEEILPPETVTDEKIEMSDLELQMLAVNSAVEEIASEKLQVLDINFNLEFYPHIWLRDKDNKISWVRVQACKEDNIADNEIDNTIKACYDNDGYCAVVKFSSLESGADSIYRTDNISVNIEKFEKVYLAHDDIAKEDINKLIAKTLKGVPMNFNRNVLVYPVADYDGMLLKISNKYVHHPEQLPKDLVMVPIEYSKEIKENLNFGLCLYYVVERDSEYAKMESVNPNEVVQHHKPTIVIIRKVSGQTISQDYSMNLMFVEGNHEDDPIKKQYIILREINYDYGKEALIRALDLCRHNVSHVKAGQLAEGSREYTFIDPLRYYGNYRKFVDSYLNYLKYISELPQRTFDKAVSDLLMPKNFVFDFYHTGNTFIDKEKKEFNFIDFFFDADKIEAQKNDNPIDEFRRIIVGMHKISSIQLMDYLVYPEDFEKYKEYVDIITEKLNKTTPEKYKLKENYLFLDEE